MRLCAIACVPLAGCHLVFGVGAPSDTDPTDAGSDAIDAGPNDGPADGPVDADRDGVPDATDNCPDAANSGQHDEDGDGYGDACDRCPHVSSTSNNDADGDGVGDVCDPNPTVGIDTWVHFDGFNDPLGAAWGAPTDGVTWMVANGTLVVDTTTASRLPLMMNLDGSITVSASLVVTVAGGMNVNAGGVLFDYNTVGSLCGLGAVSNSTKRGIFDFAPGPSLIEVSTAVGGTQGTAQTYTVTSSGMSRTCTPTGTTENLNLPNHQRQVGLGTLGARMQVSWFAAILSP